MKKIITLFMTAIVLVSVNSCKKEPLSCASADKSSALTDETIVFTSCAENAVKIAWDFGDGTKEEGNTVSHAYSKAGNYLVQSTAYSKKDKKWDRSALMVSISDPPVAPPPPPPTKRYLTKIVLKAIPNKKANGDDWDGSFGVGTSSSDPSVLLKLDSGGWSMSSATIPNITQNGLPVYWNFLPDNITLINEKWSIEIWDDAYGNPLYDTGAELMNSWTSINLSTYTASGGIISLSYGTSPDNYAIDIYFDEK